jgi:hypothetical protein
MRSASHFSLTCFVLILLAVSQFRAELNSAEQENEIQLFK